jgi:hypothetical protein
MVPTRSSLMFRLMFRVDKFAATGAKWLTTWHHEPQA